MNKSRQKKVKHKKLETSGEVLKERKYDGDCHGPRDSISNLKPEESNSDTGRMIPYLTHTAFVHSRQHIYLMCISFLFNVSVSSSVFLENLGVH
jgi:hypothetical protein